LFHAAGTAIFFRLQNGFSQSRIEKVPLQPRRGSLQPAGCSFTHIAVRLLALQGHGFSRALGAIKEFGL
jgi:hypothetical protein